ncbi:hypothetical protein AVEN_219845-1 [Araneus ventricosus]|uniref:Uncharacterized protein n=1 Tax=Araneus ventricosus TaxID=182803 RepID=A0A4Y2LG03_ARAVE|nr:hypothetical protein AVEN_219845-1 [Araneus ventricosus]
MGEIKISELFHVKFVFIVTKVVRWVCGESIPASWIIENNALFNEYSRHSMHRHHEKKQHLHKLATQADSKSLTIKLRPNGLSFHKFRQRFALFPVVGTGRIDVTRGLGKCICCFPHYGGK